LHRVQASCSENDLRLEISYSAFSPDQSVLSISNSAQLDGRSAANAQVPPTPFYPPSSSIRIVLLSINGSARNVSQSQVLYYSDPARRLRGIRNSVAVLPCPSPFPDVPPTWARQSRILWPTPHFSHEFSDQRAANCVELFTRACALKHWSCSNTATRLARCVCVCVLCMVLCVCWCVVICNTITFVHISWLPVNVFGLIY